MDTILYKSTSPMFFGVPLRRIAPVEIPDAANKNNMGAEMTHVKTMQRLIEIDEAFIHHSQIHTSRYDWLENGS